MIVIAPMCGQPIINKPWYQLTIRYWLLSYGYADTDAFCDELDDWFRELAERRVATSGDLWLIADSICDLAIPALIRYELLAPAAFANLIDLVAMFGVTRGVGPHATAEAVRRLLFVCR